MDTFKSLYFEYCKAYNAEPQEAVKSELKRLSLHTDETTHAFNLSSHHLTDKTCMILGKLLAHDNQFHSLFLNDCSLSNDGLRDICSALSDNRSIHVLELKGNNIHGEGAEHVAKLLRQNTAIKSLSLEWNSLGLLTTSGFAQLCESLNINKTLKDLDLRNNQITHSSALELCNVISTNNTLETLDLRWNNIGLVGGKGLLAALKKNTTLTQLQVAGNNIPDEILDAIALKMGHNGETVRTVKEFSKRTTSLSNELQSIQFQKDKQVNLLLNKLDLQDQAVKKTNQTISEKMKKLQFALEDRMSTMNAMTSKLSIAEADLALAEQKCADLEHTLQKFQLDKDNEIKLLVTKHKREKEELLSEKIKLERELNAMTQQNCQVDDKYKELERKCAELQASAYEAKEKLAQGQAEYQIKMVVLDDESRRLKQRHRDEVKELEASKARELERVKTDAETAEKNLRERINKMEAARHLVEDDLSRLKAKLAEQKLQHEQEVHQLKVKAQQDEMRHRKDLEERMKQLGASKEDLLNENSKMNAKLTDSQQKIASQALDIETLKKNIDFIRNQVQEKDSELIAGSEKLKSDYDKRIRAIQKEIDRSDEYKDKIHELELKLKKSEAENEIQQKSVRMENEQLKMRLKSLDDMLERLRDEEEARTKKGEVFIKEYFRPSKILTEKK